MRTLFCFRLYCLTSIALFFSAGNAVATTGHESNGGNMIGSEFISRGYLIHDYLSHLSGSNTILLPGQLDSFEQALIHTRVEVLDQPLHDSLGDPVDAVTTDDPENLGYKLIELNQTSWQAILVNNAEVYRLIFHEYLWAMGLDDTNFRISHALQYTEIAGTLPDPYDGTAPVNLDFEMNPVSGTYPSGWARGGLSGYEITSDPTEHHTGQWSARITASTGHGQFGTIMQCFAPGQYLGKTISYLGYVKTSGLNSWAGLWLRIDDSNGGVLAFDNMQDRGITGTTDWTQYSISLPVASNAVRICFGVLLDGDGTLWTDDLSFGAL